MFKKRTRPQTVVREKSIEVEETRDQTESGGEGAGEPNLPITDLIEWRKLRRAREGIDAAKLVVGDAKPSKAARKRARDEENERNKGGLSKGHADDDEANEEAKEAKARRVVRANNFTQQTNTLDVDKHLMAYIEENLTVRSRPKDNDDDDAEADKPYDPQDELFRAASEKWKQKIMGTTKEGKAEEEGSVTTSLGMLTAIPEVDLGMDTRLKNIEETEKAKKKVAEERNESWRNKSKDDEEHLVASRFYRPNLRAKSDADILRDAKLEAMGLNPQDHEHTPQYQHRSNHERPQMATDEMVMERFKKRMRK